MIEAAAFPDELAWIVRALKPVRGPEQAFLAGGTDPAWTMSVEFEAFLPSGDLALRWQNRDLMKADSFGGKTPVVGRDSGCEYSCGEVELAARLCKVAGRNHAFWVSEWATYEVPSCWQKYFLKRSQLRERIEWLAKKDKSIRNKAGLGSGGHPDIAAWRTGQEVVYIEYKGPEDTLKADSSQHRWGRAALEMGYPFLVVKGIVTAGTA
jgi:hypothetical protein